MMKVVPGRIQPGAAKPRPPAGNPPQKRPANEGPTAPPAKKPAGPMTLTVEFAAAIDEIGVETLVGEYTEVGTNHGRKFFKRTKVSNDDINVSLYFWDERDGPEFSGWWFGEQIGGAQVWSRNDRPDMLPPAKGWRIPWDGNVVKDLTVAQKQAPPTPSMKKPIKQEIMDVKKERGTVKEELFKEAEPWTPEMDERVQRSSDRVVLAEMEATQVLETASAMMEGEVDESTLKAVEELLQAQRDAITEAHKVLAAEIMDARKSAPKTVRSITKLTPRLRSVQASIAQEMARAKNLRVERQQEIQEAEEKVALEKSQLVAEEKDAKAFEEALPQMMEMVTKAEESMEAVLGAAAPLTKEGTGEMTAALASALEETEAAAAKSQAALKAAKAKVSQRITAAKNFAPKAKKTALTEYTALQERVNQAESKLNPYLRARKDFELKLEAKKVMLETADKLATVEGEVDGLLKALSSASAGEDDIAAAEAVLGPVNTSLLGALKFVEHRIQNAEGALKKDLAQMQERGLECKKKLDSYRKKLTFQAEQVQLNVMLQQGLDKVVTAEDLLAETTEAETPFLKGIEDIPTAEAAVAIEFCEAASKNAEEAANIAKTYLKAKLVDIKTLSEESQKTMEGELTQLQFRMDAVMQKVTAFKRDTATRKTHLLLTEVTTSVVDAEAAVGQVEAVAGPLSSEKLEALAADEVRDATEKTLTAEKEAAVACANAKKLLMEKQKDSAAKAASPTYTSELAMLNARLGAVTLTLQKLRKAALLGERLVKGRQLLQEKQEEMQQIEADISKVEILVTPVGDERISDTSAEEMDSSVTQVQASLAGVLEVVGAAQQAAQGSIKASLLTLLQRAKQSQEKLDEIKEQTKEQRQRLQCERLMKEARILAEKVSEALENTAAAEAPYLKGMDVLPPEEASKAISECEAAAAAAHKAISEARSFLASKSLEVRQFVDAVARSGLSEIGKLSKQNEEAVQKLAQFKQETEERKKQALLQVAVGHVAAAEEAVQKTVLDSNPLSLADVDMIDSEVAQKFCDKVAESEEEAQEKLETARKFLYQRSREKRSASDVAELSKLQARLKAAMADLEKAKATVSTHEQKIASKLLLAEVAEMIDKANADVEKATADAAPLIEDGGKVFVVASMIKMIVDAMSDYGTKKSMTKDALFGLLKKGAGPATKISKADFLTFMIKVPEVLSRPELAFAEDQCAAIFDHLDEDKDGSFTHSDFLKMFHERFVCIQGITLTDGPDLTSSAQLAKLEVDDVVEALGEPLLVEGLGITRMEIKVVKSGAKGWVTMQGNQGTSYFELFTAYASFMKGLDKALGGVQASIGNTVDFIEEKSFDLRECFQGPLADAKAELTKRRLNLSVTQAKVEQLKKRVDAGKAEHQQREAFEQRKKEEKKQAQAAALFLKSISEKVEKAQADLAKLEKSAAPLTTVSEKDLDGVTTPLSMKKSAESGVKAVESDLAEARKLLTANESHVSKAVQGPWFEAKQEMVKFQAQIEAIEVKTNTVTDELQDACEKILVSTLGTVSAALKGHITKKKTTNDAYFKSLAGDADYITEAKLSSQLKLESLKLKLSDERRELLYSHIKSKSGISRSGLLKILERYSVCVKDIAITPDFDAKKGTSPRKLAIGETVEVLEGPKVDAAGTASRVRIRAVSDGKTGWVTLRANQTTPFLQECAKPYYFAAAPVTMQDTFDTQGCAEVHKLKPHEVVEVLEGPRKEGFGNAVRAKCKTSDGTVGWFTVKNKQGEECAEQGRAIFTTTGTIALTDDMNIKTCKVIKKLPKGEPLIVVEGPLLDPSASVTRIRVSVTDEAKGELQGWVTTKGNAGSLYAEETGCEYIITKAISLQSSLSSDSAILKELTEQDSVSLLDGPKEEKTDVAVRVKGKEVSGGKVGWMSLGSGNLKPWSPRYKSVASTVITNVLNVEQSETLRRTEVGEEVELVAGPQPEPDLGVVRMKIKADKDGVVGWVTIAGNQGKLYLECIPPE